MTDGARRYAVLRAAAIAAAVIVLAWGAAGGPGWTGASDEALLAAQLERSARAPLYGAVAGAAAHLLPVGEAGFRLAVLNAGLAVLVLVGVTRAARALLPADAGWAAGLGAAILLALAPPFRDAAGFAGPGLLAACGAVWALALGLEAARARLPRAASGAVAAAGIAIGAAPWLGALLAIGVVGWLSRAHDRAYRDVLGGGVALLGALAIALWWGARGRLPGTAPDLAAVVAASGRGAAGVLVGAGLVGAAFAAVTRLRGGGWLAAAIAAAAVHAVVVDDHDPAPLIALLAVGAAVVPGAIARVIATGRGDAVARWVAPAAAAPLVAVALVAGPAWAIDDPGDAPARLADDLIGELPPGPGVAIATRAPAWSAIRYAQAIAGARPDFALSPRVADDDAFEALRRGFVAAADTPAFGRLDPLRARPRGRGFELLIEKPAGDPPVLPPARYASAIGAREATALALARARYEGSFARLDRAARAAGLTGRFRAADLALLSVVAPSRERPPLFGQVPPLEGAPGGPWLLELFGDDLAWVAGLPPPSPPVAAPAERVLHALWREVWTGARSPADPAIVALGPRAIAATVALLLERAP